MPTDSELIEFAKRTPWEKLSSSSDDSPELQNTLKELRRIKKNLEAGGKKGMPVRGLLTPSSSQMPVIRNYNPENVQAERGTFSPSHGLVYEI